jgi:DNA polymerase-4
MPSTILHMDMDAFFASVEQLRDPALRGKPVCVGGVPGQDRSVVTSASYEARPYGIRAGMPLRQAQRLCPQALFVRTNGRAYLEISKRVVGILEAFSDRVEPSSIDESYVDITGVLKYFGGAEAIGNQVRQRVRTELGLTCSVGIAPTRILAKMCTDLHKPDGLTIIAPEDIPRIIYPLKVERVPGIGPRLKNSLNSMGIFTIQQLVGAEKNTIFKHFGVNGTHLQEIVRGDLDWQVVPDEERATEKSIGNSRTFRADSDDPEVLKGYLLSLVAMVCRRLRSGNFNGRTVTLTIRYGDFHTVTRSCSLARAISDENEIFKVAWGLFEKHYMAGFPVRLLGVSLSGLVGRDAAQTDLFDRESRLYPALDALREKFGEGIVQRSSTLGIRVRKHVGNVNFAKPNTNAQRKRNS